METKKMQDVCGEFLRRFLPQSSNSSSFYGLRGGASNLEFINNHLVTQEDAFLRMMLIPCMAEHRG